MIFTLKSISYYMIRMNFYTIIYCISISSMGLYLNWKLIKFSFEFFYCSIDFPGFQIYHFLFQSWGLY